MPDGTQARLFPRLRFGGAHLADPEKEWSQDVAFTTLQEDSSASSRLSS